MVVHLKGQLAAGLDVQELDLEARSDVERLEVAPRTVIAKMLFLFLAIGALQGGDDLADVDDIVDDGDDAGVVG